MPAHESRKIPKISRTFISCSRSALYNDPRMTSAQVRPIQAVIWIYNTQYVPPHYASHLTFFTLFCLVMMLSASLSPPLQGHDLAGRPYSGRPILAGAIRCSETWQLPGRSFLNIWVMCLLLVAHRRIIGANILDPMNHISISTRHNIFNHICRSLQSHIFILPTVDLPIS